MRPLYYDRKGEPIAVEEWSRLWSDWSYRCLADDRIGDVRVATIWEGIDHNLFGTPLIFESMVFLHRSPIEEAVRYATEKEAMQGHRSLVERVRKGRSEDAADAPPRRWRTGEELVVVFEGKVQRAAVLLASHNGKSLMLRFEGLIGGFLGMMPVLWDGVAFRELMQSRVVELREVEGGGDVDGSG